MIRSYPYLLQSSKPKRQVSHPYLVGFAVAERAPLHKDPSKACSRLWHFTPELPFSRILSHPCFLRLVKYKLV